MAVTYRSSTATNTGSAAAASIVLAVPADAVVNDVLLAAIAVDGGSGATITPPAGWTLLATNTQGTNTRLSVYSRIVNGQEPTTYTWNFDTSRMASGSMLAYSDVYIFTPSSVASGNSGTASTTLTPTGSNSAYPGRALTFWGTRNTTAAASLTPAGGYTEREDTCTTASPFINLEVQDTARTYPMGGTSAATSASTQSVTQCNVIVLLEDAHLNPFTDMAVDLFQCGSNPGTISSGGASKFTTNYPNEVILAFFSINKDAQTVTSVANTSGLTWSFVGRANTQNGSVEAWRAFAPTPISNQTVTATFSASITSFNTMVMGIVGADISGTNGSAAIGAVQTASGTASTPSVSLATTRNNSLVFGMWNNPAQSIASTAGASQTAIRTGNDATNSCMSTVNMVNGVVPVSGTTATISSTVTHNAWNALAVEIVPSAAKKSMPTLGVG